MRTANRIAAVTAATTIALTLSTASAVAAPTTDGFGAHVASCAHASGGFTGDHNPGMHRGASGWDGEQCQ